MAGEKRRKKENERKELTLNCSLCHANKEEFTLTVLHFEFNTMTHCK